ncbi:putative polygalacturonate 4-alpha-galacturonosyltransferase [Helianthus annuus]|uniref:Hexosyltransferase n=2 Tax=Helianthus annuus TaxID=4232 RepID=A0A9K3ELH4_HELAN|nr:polygalacturonate 4-alpha-galacturonosyltransferase [Helianthus annuus]XP_021996894.1 polygalacturonate 4-alpha-galacturonosyltransferase [Helianthus annuus]XP_021996895.1 polygalacturonate 4-alpha-galacturonosyltransferase [Helianthus annuus]KAF5775996.1 putative polygalacturonate 4-alpha-galacturonosyltransferase [Helianthus annuus]
MATMAFKRGNSMTGGRRNSGGSGSWMSIVVIMLLLVLAPVGYFFGSGMYTSIDVNDLSTSIGKQDVDWRAKLAFQHIRSLFSKRVIDVIKASTDDLGPLSLDSFRKNNLSASWKFTEQDHVINSTSSPAEITEGTRKWTPTGKLEKILDGHSQSVDTPEKLARRKLRDKRRENRAADLVKNDNNVIIKLENAAIERSKSVDSAVLGKYSIWRKENDNENIDTTIRLVRDQMIMARVYMSIATMKNKTQLAHELQSQLKESQRALGDATADADLNHSVAEKIKAMGQLLSKAKEQLYDCKLVTGKLRAMLQSADERVRSLKKQSMFLSQIAAKTIPNGIHCLSMRLTIDYYLLPLEKRVFPRRENLENPDLYHYALFSDNVLAASVVVNSTIKNAKEPEKHVFHLVSDKLNFGAMNMWFLLNPPGKATIHVENVDEFKWLNSSYCPVLRQLESAAMKEYYFKSDHQTTGSSNLKYRNPKYLSMLNHLRFYLPQVYPKLNKILFLDDDIVVQKDLTGLWKVDLNGKVNGAVETCGESFHRFDKYLNFSNPHIARNFDPNACGWAYGMNMFDLDVWKKKDITGIYHKWQNMNEDRVLWKLGTLPPGLMTFYGLTHPLDKSWHVLGLGYNPSIDKRDIEKAAVIHYNGNMKPWLELAMTKYRSYWVKYIKFDHPYVRGCKLGE